MVKVYFPTAVRHVNLLVVSDSQDVRAGRTKKFDEILLCCVGNNDKWLTV